MMKKMLLNTIAAMAIVGFTQTLYASAGLTETEFELNLQNSHSSTNSNNNNAIEPFPFEDLPDEMQLYALTFTPVEKIRAVCKKWQVITQERLFWISIAQRLNSDVDNGISNQSLHFISSIMTRKAHIILHLSKAYEYQRSGILGIQERVSGVKDDGTIIPPRDQNRNLPFQFQSEPPMFASVSNIAGTTLAGRVMSNGQVKPFISNDSLDTYKILPMPDNIIGSKINAVSDDGCSVVGVGNTKSGQKLAFYWNNTSGTKLLPNLERAWSSDATCTNNNGHVIGGWSESENHLIRRPVIWLEQKFPLYFDDLFNEQYYPQLSSYKIVDIYKISRNAKSFYVTLIPKNIVGAAKNFPINLEKLIGGTIILQK